LENYNCWNDIQKHKKIKKDNIEELKTSSQRIYNKYLDQKSPEEVNISADVKNSLDKENVSPNSFHALEEAVFHNMKLDSYHNFLHSNEYSDYLKECVPTDVKPKIIEDVKIILSTMNKCRLEILKRLINLFKIASESTDISLVTLSNKLSIKIFQVQINEHDSQNEEIKNIQKASSLCLRTFIQEYDQLF